MADRTGLFLSQVYGFLEQDFTGEFVLRCKQGRILEMDVTQKIRIAENSSTARPVAVLLQG